LIRYDVLTTESVFGELTAGNYPGAGLFRSSRDRGEFSVLPARNPSLKLSPDDARAIPSGGEKDLILRFIGGTGDFIMIDDGKGAAYCRDRAIPYINALLFPRIMHISRHMSRSEYLEYMGRVIRFGRYSAWVIDYAYHCTSDDLTFFLP